MTFSVNALEFAWVTITLGALIFTVASYFDARSDRAAVTKLNGKARELSATRVVTRQGLLVMALVLLLAVAIPGLFLADSERREPWLMALTIGGLIAVPITLLVLSLIDTRDRKRLIILLAADALLIKTDALERIEKKVEAGLQTAERAYEAANHVKERFDAVNERITAGQDLADERHAATGATIDSTAEEVHDLHEGIAPPGGGK